MSPDQFISLNNDTGRNYHKHQIIFLCHQGIELSGIPLYASPLGKLITQNIEEWEKYIEKAYPNYIMIGGNTQQHYLSPLGGSQLSWASKYAKNAAYLSLMNDINYSRSSQNLIDINSCQHYRIAQLKTLVDEIIELSNSVTPISYIDELKHCLKLYDMLESSFAIHPLDGSDTIVLNMMEDSNIGICTINKEIERISLSDIIETIDRHLDRELIFIWVACRSY